MLKNIIYKKPEWAISQVIEENKPLQDLCKHGYMHPNLAWMADNCHSEEDWNHASHACDGCCSSNCSKS